MKARPGLRRSSAIHVAIINPATSADRFYGNLIAFMRAAAQGFDIELEVIECDRFETRMRAEGKALAGRGRRPDYLILINDLNSAVGTLPLATEAGIKTFVICQGVLAADRHLVGEPRGKHPNWLGQLLPDDRETGFLLAETLIEEARRRGRPADDGKIHVCGLAANYSPASLLRVHGLQDAVSRHLDVSLDELVLANWDSDKATWWTRELLLRNPRTTVVWAANDSMALGALEAIEEAGLAPGRDVFCGGVDWAPEALAKIRGGALTTSLGGHFMDAAWSLILLHDFHHGRDFQLSEARSKNVPTTSRNVDEVLHLTDSSQWHRIDFTRFSRVENPGLQDYDFSPRAVLEHLLAAPELCTP